MVHDQICQICGTSQLEEIPAYRELPRVTSDANPWPAGGRLCCCVNCGAAQKFVDDVWRNEIGSIYAKYALYHQAGGAEQPIFTPRGPMPRSLLIAEFIEQNAALPKGAKVLDFGCGNGSALRNFSRRHPDWKLYGSELSNGARDHLKDLPNFVDLYLGPIETFASDFDLVTMIHSLEHVVLPADILSRLLERLSSNGRLLIEVPDCQVTPYDLAISDHLTHFTLDTLQLLVHRAGFSTQSIATSVAPKELTWLGNRRKQSEPSRRIDADASVARTRKYVDWLKDQVDAARAIARESSHFGIFGTSISATWLAGAVGYGIDFFVDEDPGRIGRVHMGRPIVSPDSVAPQSDVYAPLITATARAVCDRLARKDVRYHAPPEIGL